MNVTFRKNWRAGAGTIYTIGQTADLPLDTARQLIYEGTAYDPTGVMGGVRDGLPKRVPVQAVLNADGSFAGLDIGDGVVRSLGAQTDSPTFTGPETHAGPDVDTEYVMTDTVIHVDKRRNRFDIASDGQNLSFSGTPSSAVTRTDLRIVNPFGVTKTVNISAVLSDQQQQYITSFVMPATGDIVMPLEWDGVKWRIFNEPFPLAYTIAGRPSAATVGAGASINILDPTYGLKGSQVSDGTMWCGELRVVQNIPAILPGQVTVNTTSPNLTLATAVSRIGNNGTFYAWMYLPAMGTTPAITAGWYPVQITGATTAKILDVFGGTERTFTVGASAQSNATSTGQTSSNQLQMIGLGAGGPNAAGGLPIPGNLLGPNGVIEIEAVFDYTNDGGNKYLGIQMGTTLSSSNLITQLTATTTSDWRPKATSRNIGVTNQQLNAETSGADAYQFGTGTGTGTLTAFDTTVDQRLGFYAGLAAPATQNVALLGATIKLICG